MKLPEDEDELRLVVARVHDRVADLEARLKGGDKAAFKAMKITRHELTSLQATLRHAARHEHDEDRKDLLVELLASLS